MFAMSRRGWTLFLAMAVIWGIPYLLIRVAVRQLAPGVIRIPDDSALRQMLDREHVQYKTASRVFHPFRPGHAH